MNVVRGRFVCVSVFNKYVCEDRTRRSMTICSESVVCVCAGFITNATKSDKRTLEQIFKMPL